MTNRVREVRKESGQSQEALAKAAGTCLSHIRQIEAGLPTIPRVIADKIALFLGTPLVRLFPQTPAEIDDPKHSKLLENPRTNELSFETYVKLIKPQTDFTDHTAVNLTMVHFRGGRVLSLAVTDQEQRRLDRVLYDLPRRSDFVVIDALDHVVAVNPNHVTRIQHLFEDSGHEARSIYILKGDWSPIPDHGLAWLPAHDSTLTVINVEPDNVSLDDETEEPSLYVKLYDLEKAEYSRMLTFDDIDGETEYVNTDDIAAVAIHRMWLADFWDIWNSEEGNDPLPELTHGQDRLDVLRTASIALPRTD